MIRSVSRFVAVVALVASALVPGSGAFAQQAQPQAWDGQTLSQQAADVQASFQTVWGAKAAQQWAAEHSKSLIVAQLTALGAKFNFRIFVPTAPPVPADTTVAKLNTLKTNAPITGDLIDIDQQAHLLYVGNGSANAIEVYDVSTATPKWVKAITVPGGVAGILFVPDLMKVFGGSPNGLAIVDVDPNSPTNGKLITTLSFGPGGTDELDYDPVNKKVYVTDVADHTIASVNAVTNTTIKTFTSLADDSIEQPRYNPADGYIYVSFRGTNQIAKFNPTNDTLVSITPLGVPCNPSGLAIKASTNLALLACRDKPEGTLFWNLTTNTMVSFVPNGGGGDGALYSPKADRFFVANSRMHTGPVMSIFDGSGNFVTNVPTTPLSHQVGYDKTNNVVYTLGGGLVYFTPPR